MEQDAKIGKGLDHALAQVREFHEKFGHPVGEYPRMMDPATTSARAKFSAEEVQELLDAPDIYEQVDSALDRIYFALGDLVILGVTNVQELMDAVQEANLAKLWPDGNPRYDPETGKVIKPPFWKENHDPKEKIKAIIDRQIQEYKG